MDEPLVRALPSAELLAESAGEPRLRRVRIRGTDILLGRLSTGPVVAFGTTCPHQKTNLEEGTFFDGRILCPLHTYLYDPETGENIVPARDANPANLWKLKPGYLPVFTVEERDGWIWVGSQPKPPPGAYDPEREERPPPGSLSATPPPVAAPVAPGGPIEHPAESLRVRSGTTFDLRLPTTPRPGFLWRVDPTGPLLAVVEERYQPGVPPHHLVRVTARQPGEATVRCGYARPWDSQPAEIRTYQVRITAG